MQHASIKSLALNANNTHMMKKLLIICLSFVTTMAMAQKMDEPAAIYAALITPKSLKEKLTILAGADMEGRETASPGQKKAAAYIEDHFKKIGLQPGNGNIYQQLFPVYFDPMTDPLLRVHGRTFAWEKVSGSSVSAIIMGQK